MKTPMLAFPDRNRVIDLLSRYENLLETVEFYNQTIDIITPEDVTTLKGDVDQLEKELQKLYLDYFC